MSSKRIKMFGELLAYCPVSQTRSTVSVRAPTDLSEQRNGMFSYHERLPAIVFVDTSKYQCSF